MNKTVRKGDILISVLVFAAIAVTMTIGLVEWGASLLMGSRVSVQREQALQIADAGLSYYQAHLLQFPQDYQDGTGHAGPYSHDFLDKNGNVIGSFTLTINAPATGHTKVDVTSKGAVLPTPGIPSGINISRTLLASFVQPSLAGFPIVSNSEITSASGTSVYGPVDFYRIANDLHSLQTIASSSGFDYPPSQYDDKPASGYHVVLNPDNTFTLYVVTAQTPAPGGCSDVTTGWGTWGIQSQVFVGTYNLPAQGLLYFEDDVWVDGNINGARLTIVSGSNIIVNSNLTYTKHDGSDSVGLLALKNINIGLVSSDNLHIDGALFAVNGRVGRYFYPSSCRVDGVDYSARSTLTLNGMIATNQSLGFTYTDGTGYLTRNMGFDTHLATDPQPYFPLVSGALGTSVPFKMFMWRELY